MNSRYLYFLVTGKRAPRRSPRRRARGPARSRRYLAWIRTQPCIVCEHPETQACHTQHNGMASKGSDFSAVPLCVMHHREYDSGLRSKALFELDHGINMADVVSRLNQIYSEAK